MCCCRTQLLLYHYYAILFSPLSPLLSNSSCPLSDYRLANSWHEEAAKLKELYSVCLQHETIGVVSNLDKKEFRGMCFLIQTAENLGFYISPLNLIPLSTFFYLSLIDLYRGCIYSHEITVQGFHFESVACLMIVSASLFDKDDINLQTSELLHHLSRMPDMNLQSMCNRSVGKKIRLWVFFFKKHCYFK